MPNNQSRIQAIQQITSRTLQPVSPPPKREDIWAEDVFTLAKMRAMLPKSVFKSLKATIEEGGKLDTETRLRYKRNAAWAVRQCVEAVDALHEMAGANGIYDHYPLQRVFRDQRAAAAHISFSTDAQLPPWGLVALGGDFKSPTL